jgi:hypothetical protein
MLASPLGILYPALTVLPASWLPGSALVAIHTLSLSPFHRAGSRVQRLLVRPSVRCISLARVAARSRTVCLTVFFSPRCLPMVTIRIGVEVPGRFDSGAKQKTLLVVKSGRRMIKPCGLVCCVAYPYALAILCPIASVTLHSSSHRSLLPASSLFPPLLPSPVSQPRLPARLAPPQRLSHCLLALPAYPRPRGLTERASFKHRIQLYRGKLFA